MSPTAEVASDLLIEGNRIAGIVPSTTSTRDDWLAIDGEGAVLFPGMIDLLQHGYASSRLSKQWRTKWLRSEGQPRNTLKHGLIANGW